MAWCFHLHVSEGIALIILLPLNTEWSLYQKTSNLVSLEHVDDPEQGKENIKWAQYAEILGKNLNLIFFFFFFFFAPLWH